VSPSVWADLHQVDVGSSSDSLLYVPMAITGSVLLDPGTYNIGVVCAKLGAGNGTVLVNNAAMNVVAVPASS
jgi:hypothetical protein